MLTYKEDWGTAKQRLLAWWDREIIDRVVIQVTAPRPGRRVVTPPDDLVRRWTDVDYVLDAAEARLEGTYYAGESFPCYWPNLGPDVFAGYLGCEIQFGENTSWSVPFVKEWWQFPCVQFDRQNRWWELTQLMLKRSGERFQGKAILGFTDIHGGGDAVAALRDPQTLALDLVDHPEEVLMAMECVESIWFDVYAEQLDLIRQYSAGASTWMNLWHPGKWYPVSCDFICMISPAMVEKFILPELLAEISYLDRSIFHLDGPGALKHLDALLAIDKLGAIQWVPGANSGPIAQWFPILKRIQAAGKGLQIHIEPRELESVMETLRPEGLCICTGASTIEEADALVQRAKALTHAR